MRGFQASGFSRGFQQSDEASNIGGSGGSRKRKRTSSSVTFAPKEYQYETQHPDISVNALRQEIARVRRPKKPTVVATPAVDIAVPVESRSVMPATVETATEQKQAVVIDFGIIMLLTDGL